MKLLLSLLVVANVLLFGWLRGEPQAVPGWSADLSALAAGRLSARRLMPLPTAELRVILDR